MKIPPETPAPRPFSSCDNFSLEIVDNEPVVRIGPWQFTFSLDTWGGTVDDPQSLHLHITRKDGEQFSGFNDWHNGLHLVCERAGG